MSKPKLSAEACAEAIDAWEVAGHSRLKAAEALGLNLWTFRSRLEEALRRQGFAPGGVDAGPARDGLDPYTVKGVSTYFNKNGEQGGQWVKTKVDEERRLAAITAAIEDRINLIEPRQPTLFEHGYGSVLEHSPKLLNLVTVTDYHIGMLAWHREGGADWDTPIARETFRRVFGGMLSSLPAAETCVINQLGDMLHTDGMLPVTPGHGNVLDADSRYQKMASVAADLLEELVVMALETHPKVHVIMAEGNHDESGSAWLRVMFRRIFRDEPRVTVDDSPLPYYAYQHGSVMLGFHHGHKLKPDELPMLFAAEPRFSAMWGACRYRYGHLGHQHNLYERDKNGMTVLQHPTVAARDAFAARGGWVSERRALAITYHTELGEVGRSVHSPEMYGL